MPSPQASEIALLIHSHKYKCVESFVLALKSNSKRHFLLMFFNLRQQAVSVLHADILFCNANYC